MIRENIVKEFENILTRWIIAKQEGNAELYEIDFPVIINNCYFKMSEEEKNYVNKKFYNKDIKA